MASSATKSLIHNDVAAQNASAGGGTATQPFKTVHDFPFKTLGKRQRAESLLLPIASVPTDDPNGASRQKRANSISILNEKGPQTTYATTAADTSASHPRSLDISTSSNPNTMIKRPLTPRESAAVLEVEFVSDSEGDDDDVVGASSNADTSTGGTMKSSFELDMLASVAAGSSSGTSRELAMQMRGLNAFNASSSSAFRRPPITKRLGNASETNPRAPMRSASLPRQRRIRHIATPSSPPSLSGYRAVPADPLFLGWLQDRVNLVLFEIERINAVQYRHHHHHHQHPSQPISRRY